ncbi:Error-prone DNA polymerase [compost metagenome]
MATADLHLHTTFSDGRFTPSELVDAAALAGLKAIAVTDHDHTGGLVEARERAARYRLEVLTGVEINTVWQDRELHVLGYCFDESLDWWNSLMVDQREARERRMERFVARLQENGLPVTMEDVRLQAGEGALGRPHLAQALIAKGLVSTEQQAFDRWLSSGTAGYVPREGLSPAEAIRAIRKAGGVASIAHPRSAPLEGGNLIGELVEVGLGALEVVHPSHPPVLRDYYRSMAEHYGLLWTGGTDDHGPKGGRPARIGSDSVPYSVVEALKARAG